MRSTIISRVARPSIIAKYASPTSNKISPNAVNASGSSTTKQKRPRGNPTGVASEVGLAAAALLPPLPLFRRILKAHKSLPIEMKSIGDQYVKDEFKRHSKIDNPLQIVGFLTQWKIYLDNLEESNSINNPNYKGKQLDVEQFNKLSDEQLYQLHELMTVTKELFDPEKAQAQPPGGNQAVHDAVQEALNRANQQAKGSSGSGGGESGDGNQQR